ncbi:MAG: GDP-mannose 4,6-dehydratase [Proteobacteria bacterium]|nr:GDP-mannose 4,6-dehydratase [Pseudomonadota bacterium]NBP13758.1 GDP-mannose 4,6-dehydratase [bacterium]
MSRKVVLITGIGGMDGSYAAELWLEQGYEVHGIIRRASNFNTQRIEHIFSRISLHYGDVTDMGNVLSIIQQVKPTMILNFAAMSHVKVSFELENYTFQTNTIGILNILQAVRILGMDQTTRIYHASTSEMYGNITDGATLLTEDSPMLPVSPYGISKLAAYHLCNYYRDAYKMFVVSSVLLNHEGERRGHTFVTKKITDYVGNYRKRVGCGSPSGLKKLAAQFKPLQLGNLDSKRDWGYARDYVEGIWLMMNHQDPDNYVLATGETHSVREFAELAFAEIGVRVEWKGRGESEIGVDAETGKTIIQVNKKYYRPIDIEALIGDYSKAKRVLGWQPKTSFKELVKLMVNKCD